MTERVLITGGLGYIGATSARRLLAGGTEVRVLDSLLQGQDAMVPALGAAGVDVVVGDVRDPGALERALADVDAVVHLAAIVGDPACAADPDEAASVNVEGSRAVVAAARAAGVPRLVFASTCSNYGRLDDPETPVREDAPLRPVSLYAEQKVLVERELLALPPDDLRCTVLRFATIYGLAERMRFDLTVNEFSRDLFTDRDLEVFGEQFWRPYVHVADAARAIRLVLESPGELTVGEVFNVGATAENHTKKDLVALIREQVPTGRVSYVTRHEDPRDYKVDFAKVRDVLGFMPERTVRDGIREIATALSEGRFEDPWNRRHRNSW
jgi:nucleoside-diphosphate-sugar epimerase